MVKSGVKKCAGRPLSYGSDLEEQFLSWILERRNLHLPCYCSNIVCKR